MGQGYSQYCLFAFWHCFLGEYFINGGLQGGRVGPDGCLLLINSELWQLCDARATADPNEDTV